MTYSQAYAKLHADNDQARYEQAVKEHGVTALLSPYHPQVPAQRHPARRA